jgi:hypothetical protein
MTVVALASLIAKETKAAIYQKGLDVATALGLPVTSWSAGDPTRSLYHFVSEILSTLEGVVVGYVASGFLDFSVARANADQDDRQWLVLLAEQVYGYTATDATYATATITLTNGGGGLYPIEAGDLTFRDPSTGATFHNTSAGTLNSGIGQTVTLDIEADDPGSASSAGVGTIIEMVTTLLDVTCTNPTAAVGLDDEEPTSIAAGCRAKLGALSPNGPRAAYEYVATRSDLTGTTNVTRARSVGDSATGRVSLYLAGPSGDVAGGDVTLVQAAIEQYATPLCITPTAASAAAKPIAPTYELWLYDTAGYTEVQAHALVVAALQAMMTARPIAGDVIPPATSGYVYHSLIESTIASPFPGEVFRVSVTVPAADTAIAANEVPVLGNVTPTAIHFIPRAT